MTRADKAGKKSIVRHDEPNEPTKEGHLSHALQEYTFESVSTVRGTLLSLSPIY